MSTSKLEFILYYAIPEDALLPDLVVRLLPELLLSLGHPTLHHLAHRVQLGHLHMAAITFRTGIVQSGSQGIRKSGSQEAESQEIRKSGSLEVSQEIRKSGSHEVRKSGSQEVRKLGSQEV